MYWAGIEGLLSEHRAVTEDWGGIEQVLRKYWASTEQVLSKYWVDTEWVLTTKQLLIK